MDPDVFLEYSRVPKAFPPQQFGLWTIERVNLQNNFTAMLRVGWSYYTLLRRITMATLHQEPGEVVMEDSVSELRKHLPIWMVAHGRVLVSGLGLGCVVRGLLLNPAIEHVDVIELDSSILRVIGEEFVGNSKVDLHLGDALKFKFSRGTKFDFAWHDIWTDGPEHLDVLHLKLIMRYRRQVREKQGAWNLNRVTKRVLHRDSQLRAQLLR